jgi:hypothetical protein
LLAAIAGVLGTGIGGVAFLTFVGGTILLARFRGAGISAPTALPLVERQRLLVTGADQLVAFLVAGASVALMICLAYWVGRKQIPRAPALERALLVVAALAGLLYYLWWAPAVDGNPGWFLFAVALLLLAAGVAYDRFTEGERGSRVLRRRVVLICGVLVGGAYYLWKAPPLDEYPFLWGFGAATLLLLVGAIAVDHFGNRSMNTSQGDVGTDDAAPLWRSSNGALASVIAIAFVAVAMYSVFVTYARNIKDPWLNPAALLVREPVRLSTSQGEQVAGAASERSTSQLQAAWGIYVGTSDDRVYLAWTTRVPVENPDREPLRHARLIGFRREDVVDIAIGSLVPPRPAKVIAPGLCQQLIARVAGPRPECVGHLQPGKSGK